MVVVVDNFGFGSGFCGFWLWVSWFMDVVVAVAVGCSCDGWLSWLVVVVLFYCFFFCFVYLFFCVVLWLRVEGWLWPLVVVFVFLLFYYAVYVILLC